jgi:hypothetical protein
VCMGGCSISPAGTGVTQRCAAKKLMPIWILSDGRRSLYRRPAVEVCP